jgi:hypothetical protein
MATRLVRAPNSPILIVAGLALLVLGAVGVERVVLSTNHYRVPTWFFAEGPIVTAILGLALLFVAVRRSKFAGVTAVIVAAFITFRVAFGIVLALTFERSAHVTWWTAIDLAIVAALLWSSTFPWDRAANKPVLFWIVVTIGTLMLLCGSLAVLARL